MPHDRAPTPLPAIARGHALRAIDPSILADLQASNHALVRLAGEASAHDWLGGDDEDRRHRAVLLLLETPGRRCGICLQRDGTFAIIISAVVPGGAFAVFETPITPATAMVRIHTWASRDADRARRMLAERLSSAIEALSRTTLAA